MAKWIFTRANGTWSYPTLGFTATLNDVIEADNAPDAWWEETDSGATVTIPVEIDSDFVETPGDSVLAYDQDRNEYGPKTLDELMAGGGIPLSTSAVNAAITSGLSPAAAQAIADTDQLRGTIASEVDAAPVVKTSGDQSIAGKKSFAERVTGFAFIAKGAGLVNVLAHGADPTGVTASAVAVSTAITEAGVGGTVEFPYGTFVVNSALSAALADQRIKCDGTILKPAVGSTGSTFTLNNDGIEAWGFVIDNSAAAGTGNFGVRVAADGADVHDFEVIGNNATRGINLRDSAFTSIREMRMSNVKWGLLTDSDADISDFLLSKFFIDGGGLEGDGIQFNVPTGSWHRIEVGSGIIANYLKGASSSNGMGVGFAGAGSSAFIHHVQGHDLGLDLVHFETDGSLVKYVHVHDIIGEAVARSVVAVQSDAGTVEGVNVHDITASDCSTNPVTTTRGTVEFAGATGSIQGSSARGIKTFDCGSVGQDAVGVLLGAVTSHCTVGDVTVARQLGTRAAGSIEIVDTGTDNSVATAVSY